MIICKRIVIFTDNFFNLLRVMIIEYNILFLLKRMVFKKLIKFIYAALYHITSCSVRTIIAYMFKFSRKNVR